MTISETLADDGHRQRGFLLKYDHQANSKTIEVEILRLISCTYTQTYVQVFVKEERGRSSGAPLNWAVLTATSNVDLHD